MSDHSTETRADGSHIGRSQTRFEDQALLRGLGRYADDLATPPGTLHAAVVRSPHAHARVLSVDASEALALKGVRAVLTNLLALRRLAPQPVLS